MLILYEGELLHTDSSTDILEHYGVKVMRWGIRRNKKSTVQKANIAFWKKKADKIDQNRSKAGVDKTTHKKLYNDIRKDIEREALMLNNGRIDRKTGDLFVRSQISDAYSRISKDKRYNPKSYSDLKRTVMQDTDIHESDLVSTAYSR